MPSAVQDYLDLVHLSFLLFKTLKSYLQCHAVAIKMGFIYPTKMHVDYVKFLKWYLMYPRFAAKLNAYDLGIKKKVKINKNVTALKC